MFCEECGNEVKNNADICISCGVPIVNHNTNDKNNNGTIKTILGIFAVIIGIMIISIFLWIMTMDEKTWQGCDNWCINFRSEGYNSYLECHNDCMGEWDW